MTRLDDLIDLIQTTNEVYFITAPGRVRTAYILVDDIVELGYKTFLQLQALQQRDACMAAMQTNGLIQSERHRSQLRRYFTQEDDINDLCNALGRSGPAGLAQVQSALAPFPFVQHWSTNQPDARKVFDDIIDEVKTFFASDPIMLTMLDDSLQRHKTRNKFYHDHQQTGLTIDDDKCLRALCDMFQLMEKLFSDFVTSLQRYKIVRCQIHVLRLKLSAHGSRELTDPYNQALAQLEKSQRLNVWSKNYEHSVLHTVSDSFFTTLREELKSTIAQFQLRVDKINGMSRHTSSQMAEKNDKLRIMGILTQQLTEIEAILAT